MPCAQVMRITFVVHEHAQRPTALQVRQRESQRPSNYVLVPDPLIIAFADDPLAVGVYAAVARLVAVAKDAVPLAARDLVAWMGSERESDRAAVMRRIVKLEQAGWLMVDRQSQHKHHLLPAWGRDRAGQPQPWRLDVTDTGRPAYLRGRRVPVGLFDTYLGRLDPRPGHRRALISRYLTRPLLTLTDIGVYTIGLRAEVAPADRLQQLHLQSNAGMSPPAPSEDLLARAVSGALTITLDGLTVAVGLTMQGYMRLGIVPPALPTSGCAAEQVFGSPSESLAGSAAGSISLECEAPHLPHESAVNGDTDATDVLIAWDVGIEPESTNHESPAHEPVGGGEVPSAPPWSESTTSPLSGDAALSVREEEWNEGSSQIMPHVAAGHRALNPKRAISTGEWLEVLTLQQTVGANLLLIWQARATRAQTARQRGVTPAYYRACAAHHAYASYAPGTVTNNLSHLVHPAPVAIPQAPQVDPACAGLLVSMGIRNREALVGVPQELIRSWADVISHPGLAARFTSPVGFAVSQMRQGNQPPPVEELDRWSTLARRAEDRYEAWRHIEQSSAAPIALSAEAQIETRVRSLAPPDASLAELCELAHLLEAGTSDDEVAVHVQRMRRGGTA
jgi:hypothetical protein